MNRARAEQIIRLTFYKHIDNLSAAFIAKTKKIIEKIKIMLDIRYTI